MAAPKPRAQRRPQRSLAALVLVAVIVSALSLWIAKYDPRGHAATTPSSASASASGSGAGAAAAPWFAAPGVATAMSHGPSPVLMEALSNDLGDPDSLREVKTRYLAANRYPFGVVRATPEMWDLLNPNKRETLVQPVAPPTIKTKPSDERSVIFETGINRSVGKDPIPLRLLVLKGRTEQTPERVTVVTTMVKRLNEKSEEVPLGSFVLSRRAGSEELTGSWVPPAALEGYNGPLLFMVKWQVPGLDTQGSLAMLEYSDEAPGTISGVARDELAAGSIDVYVAADIKTQGRYVIDGRVYAADGKTPIGFAQATPELAPGKTEVKLTFYGLLFHDAKTAGPYVVTMITGHIEAISPNGARGREMRAWTGTHTTKPYALSELTDKEFDSPAKQAALKTIDQQIADAEAAKAKAKPTN